MLRSVKWAGLMVGIALPGLPGCSLGGDDEKAKTEPAKTAANEVAATVAALDRAVRAGDWGTVCKRLFTPSARRRSGGEAQAQVRTRARAQAAVEDTLTLRPAGAGYRIESLR
jgi:hypothetical protein